MKITFNLTETQSSISQKILLAIKDHLSTIFTSGLANSLQPIISKEIKNAITQEPEYISLISGQLKSELGIPDAATKVDQLLQHWSNSVVVSISPITIKGSKLIGKLSLDMIPSDFSDVLGLSAATVTDNVTGSIIPWLQWLLLDGTKILIQNYEVRIGPNTRSRTGNAIMVVSNQKDWRVPAEFAGTIHDNWITRAISRLNDTISDKIQQELEKRI